MSSAASSHNCSCLHVTTGYRPKVCECGVYEDEHGRWCANENCRAKLGDPTAAYTPVEALRMIAASPCSVNMRGGCVGATQQVRVRGTGPHTDPPTEREYRIIVGCPKHFALQVLGEDDG